MIAAPSRANWTEGQPRECAGCGRKLRITRDPAIWLDTHKLESWHFDCRLADLRGTNPSRLHPEKVRAKQRRQLERRKARRLQEGES